MRYAVCGCSGMCEALHHQVRIYLTIMWQLRIDALMVETRSEQENQRSMESSNVDDQKHEPRSCVASWLGSHRSCAPTTSLGLTNGMYASKKNHAMNRSW